MSDKHFDVRFAVSVPRPRVSLNLHIAPDGQADMYLDTSLSMPETGSDRVGLFEGRVSAQRLAPLQAYLREKRFFERPSAPAPGMPGLATRTLTLARGGRQAAVSLTSPAPDPVVQGLERLLVAAMRELLEAPAEAVQVALAVKQGPEGLQPELVLTGAGSRPVPLVVFDPAMMGFALQCEVGVQRQGQRLSTVRFGHEQLVPLAAAGAVPSGLHSLDPGAKLHIPLQPVTLPEGGPAELKVIASFTLAGPGLARRRAEVHLPAVPLAVGPTATAQAPTPVAPTLELKAPKQRYGLDDPVDLTVVLRNPGPAPLLVNGRLLVSRKGAPDAVRDVWIDVGGPAGYQNTAFSMLNAGPLSASMLQRLEAGQQIERHVRLTSQQSLHVPGRYVLIARYRAAVRLPGHDYWMGELSAPPLVIERR